LSMLVRMCQWEKQMKFLKFGLVSSWEEQLKHQ
jgi:hypothetical protein